jgi:hypothetical protein
VRKHLKMLVCGGRDYDDDVRVWEVLDEVHKYCIDNDVELTIIHGAAPGADTLVKRWVIEHDLEEIGFPADWDNLKRAAGPIRNKQMLDEGKPNGVIAFPGGPGTANMIKQAKARGIHVHVIE